MVKVVLPCGFIYHEPPYTDAEVADLYRRMSNIVSFTRPGGQRAAAALEPGNWLPLAAGRASCENAMDRRKPSG